MMLPTPLMVRETSYEGVPTWTVAVRMPDGAVGMNSFWVEEPTGAAVETLDVCGDGHHVPTSMIFVAPSSYWLYCGCRAERCGNVQMSRAAAKGYGLPLLFESGDARRAYEAENLTVNPTSPESTRKDKRVYCEARTMASHSAGSWGGANLGCGNLAVALVDGHAACRTHVDPQKRMGWR